LFVEISAKDFAGGQRTDGLCDPGWRRAANRCSRIHLRLAGGRLIGVVAGETVKAGHSFNCGRRRSGTARPGCAAEFPAGYSGNWARPAPRRSVRGFSGCRRTHRLRAVAAMRRRCSLACVSVKARRTIQDFLRVPGRQLRADAWTPAVAGSRRRPSSRVHRHNSRQGCPALRFMGRAGGGNHGRFAPSCQDRCRLQRATNGAGSCAKTI